MKPLTTLISAVILFTASFPARAQKFWLTTYEFPNGPKTGIALAADSALFVSYQQGVLRSFNQGDRFEVSLRSTALFTIYADHSGRVLAGGAGKIFASSNLGETWDSISVNSIYPITQFVENSAGQLFAISGTLDVNDGFVGDGVFFSGDGGATWTQRNAGLSIYRCAQRIAVDKNDRLYLAVADEMETGKGGLFYSDDNGLQWKHVNLLIDGKNSIPDQIAVQSVTGLSVTPDDQVIISLIGVADRVAVQLNLSKKIAEVTDGTFWKTIMVSNSNLWWNDRLLGPVFAALNGDLYSSIAGSMNQGGTSFLEKGTTNWLRIDYGLGLDAFAQRNFQWFVQAPSGKIFMIQMLDERVYQTDQSMETSTPEIIYNKDLRVYPNPINRNGPFRLKNQAEMGTCTYTLTNSAGSTIWSKNSSHATFLANAPSFAGIYFLIVQNGKKRCSTKIVVR